MLIRLNRLLDWLSDFLSRRKGLLPMIGIVLVIANFILQLFPTIGWLADSDLLLHLGVVVAIFGIVLAWAL